MSDMAVCDALRLHSTIQLEPISGLRSQDFGRLISADGVWVADKLHVVYNLPTYYQ